MAFVNKLSLLKNVTGQASLTQFTIDNTDFLKNNLNKFFNRF